MKASHLVMILEHIIDEYGDMTVIIEDSEQGPYTLDTVSIHYPSYGANVGPITWRIHDTTNDIVVSNRPDPPPEAPYIAWVECGTS